VPAAWAPTFPPKALRVAILTRQPGMAENEQGQRDLWETDLLGWLARGATLQLRQPSLRTPEPGSVLTGLSV